MTKEQFAEKLVAQFPEKEISLLGHYQNYKELLGHIFFADEINAPLMHLLEKCENTVEIEKYCTFIEEMWFQGDSAVKNIVEVSILERLIDEDIIWQRFGSFISKEFKESINDQIVPVFRKWLDVSFLNGG